MKNDIECIDDLRHDLAKYLRQPLAYLPKDAPQEAVESAIDRALLETRRGPQGARPAAEIWHELQSKLSAEFRATREFNTLQLRVESALALAHAPHPRDRAIAMRVFDEVLAATTEALDRMESTE